MKFGGLSEQEVKKISKILSQDVIAFEVSQDEEIQAFNTRSIKNNLRHYSPPNISNHSLAITIEDGDILNLSSPAREALLQFGITDQAPAPEDFVPHSGATIHEKLAKDTNRALAFSTRH